MKVTTRVLNAELAQSYRHQAATALSVDRGRRFVHDGDPAIQSRDSMSAILLVRHAESTLNADRVVQHPDTPLSPHGMWQAGRLADRLREARVSHVASSDYARAEATARTICDAAGARLTIDPILRERNLGVLRGRPVLGGRRARLLGDARPRGRRALGGIRRRVSTDCGRGWSSCTHAAAGPVAVVTHGLVCRGLARRHLTLPADAAPPRIPQRLGDRHRVRATLAGPGAGEPDASRPLRWPASLEARTRGEPPGPTRRQVTCLPGLE